MGSKTKEKAETKVIGTVNIHKYPEHTMFFRQALGEIKNNNTGTEVELSHNVGDGSLIAYVDGTYYLVNTREFAEAVIIYHEANKGNTNEKRPITNSDRSYSARDARSVYLVDRK